MPTFSFSILNRTKSEYMIVPCRRTPCIPSSPMLLESQPLEVFPGEHALSICSKARKILGLLYGRFCDDAPGTSLLQLYISLVLPHLDCALAIWQSGTWEHSEVCNCVLYVWPPEPGTVATKIFWILLTSLQCQTTGYSTLITLQDLLQAMLVQQWYFHSMHIT